MIVEQLFVHGEYAGLARGEANRWSMKASRAQRPEESSLFSGWDDTQVFPTRQALLEALDAYLGPAQVATLAQQAATRDAAEQRERAHARTDAAARTFTGDHYDPERPLKETASLIAKDLQAAMRAGTLPRNRYRVTMRGARWSHQQIIVWMWGRDDATQEVITTITKRYNRCEGVPRDPYDDVTTDHWHFEVRYKEPTTQEMRAIHQAGRRGEMSTDEAYTAWMDARARQHLADTGRAPDEK